MRRWLITGGCGFIGRALVHRLTCEDGYSLRILDNLVVGGREDLSAVCSFVETPTGAVPREWPDTGVSLVVGDILDNARVHEACAGADVVVHLAANTGVSSSVQDPRADCETNVLGTLNVLEAARRHGIRRFVFASSGAPIGECEPPIHEELVPHPISPYGASKLAGEAYCSVYFRTFGVETVTLRFGNVYGPHSAHKSSVVAKFIRNALDGEALEVYGDGRQTRDFVYIEDLVRAIQRAVFAEGVGGEVFQIATNTEATVQELVETLLDVLEEAGCEDEIRTVHGEPRLGDVRRNFSDTRKARQRLGWTSQIGLRDGLRRTVDWFVSARTVTA